jgi:hypothetical protein
VLDNSGVDYMLAFCPNGTQVFIGSLTNSGLSNVSLLLWDNAVAVSHHGIPPQAPQPGVDYPLDTGDNRFENRSIQVGSRILNVATVNDAGFAAPAWYNFNIGVSPPTLVSEGVWFASSTSYDWHPSVNANTVAATAGTPLGEIFATWMSTDVTNNVNVQLRAVGGIGDDPRFGNGIRVFTSPLPLTNQTDSLGRHRTGDYSSIALYPAAALGCQAGEVGILDGETAAGTAGLWSTRIGIVRHCAVPGAIAPAASPATAATASAQDSGLQISSDAAKSVDLRTAPEVPPVARPAGLAINRPTMPMADYLAAKNAAAARNGGSRPQSGAAPPSTTGVSLYTQVASTNESQTSGGNVLPPDGDVATSASWMVQVNNDVVTMYNWNTNAFVQKKFSTFFQDATDFLFDPRVIYDPYWDRFAVLVDVCNPCSGAGTQSTVGLAISQTNDPTGAYWIYIGLPPTLGDFVDFPQLDMDLNSLVITFNDFLAGGGFDARTFAVAKA